MEEIRIRQHCYKNYVTAQNIVKERSCAPRAKSDLGQYGMGERGGTGEGKGGKWADEPYLGCSKRRQGERGFACPDTILHNLKKQEKMPVIESRTTGRVFKTSHFTHLEALPQKRL